MDLQTLKTMHPSWNIVDYKVAPNGGIWAAGADGAIFALDSSGGTAGSVAPFLGSYTSLAPEQRQGQRNFVRLDLDPSGGYRLISANQEQYAFAAPAPPSPVTTPPPVNTTGTQQATGTSPATGQSLSGAAAIHAVFDPLGLGSLADAALNFLNGTPGATADYVTGVWLPQQQTYKQMFPEIAQAQQQVAQGKNVAIPTAAQIVSYRQTAQQMVNQGLIPPELATNDKVGQLIVGGVSASEFENRVVNGWAQLQSAPDDLAAFLAYHPALDASHAVAALLDPTLGDVAARNAITAAQIGGASTRSGFGTLSAGEAGRLQQAGYSGATAGSALEQAALQNPLTQNLLGETDTVSRGTQIGAIAHNAEDQAAIDRRLASRQALFQGGGGAGQTGGRGGTGLGSPG